MKKYVELRTYAQMNPQYFSDDADQYRSEFVVSESDLYSLYEKATGKRLEDSRQDISLDEAKEIYRQGRKEGLVMYERIIPVQTSRYSLPAVYEETMVDIAICIGTKLSKDYPKNTLPRNLVSLIRKWAFQFENMPHGNPTAGYIGAIEQFADEKWSEYMNSLK